MGSTVGVHTTAEVGGLKPPERELLKQHVIHHLQTSEEISQIIAADPKLLTTLTSDPKINALLREKAGPLLRRLLET
jgi:hypothetical protein